MYYIYICIIYMYYIYMWSFGGYIPFSDKAITYELLGWWVNMASLKEENRTWTFLCQFSPNGQ